MYYKLRSWIDETKLTYFLSCNENAVEYLKNNPGLINDHLIFRNANAMDIIEERIEYDIENSINYNKNAVTYLRNNRKYVRYDILCNYDYGIEFMEELIQKNNLCAIKWAKLSMNPAAMYIFENKRFYKYIHWRHIIYNVNCENMLKYNLDKVNNYWYDICAQPHLINLIMDNMDKINWWGLSMNYNAIHILKNNLDKVDIPRLQLNKHGFEILLKLNHVFDFDNYYHENIMLDYFDYCDNNGIHVHFINKMALHACTEKHFDYLQKNRDIINYSLLSQNPNIFVYDYEKMKNIRTMLPWYNHIITGVMQ
jgi:hypothetical protein